ncbi:Hsp20/alpha crystallin family protein [Patescibacteria group bacterium]|nr:Hsp20/alpha crystallin family protein [Patescibacteria group bacterium]
MAKKLSFFDRLTGSTAEEEDAFSEEEARHITPTRSRAAPAEVEDVGEAQLTVDMYETPSEIVVKALVAGVRPEDLDISITRDMVTIRGRRVESKEIDEESFVYRELFWGAFSRTIVLPAEVDVDMAEAEQKHGLLTIHLPKINKDRQTKLKVRG